MIKSNSVVGFIPKKGHIVWLNFDPQAGHEQAGRRPALVISGINYNKVTGLAMICPITSKAKGYPFEVVLSETKTIGVILSNQIKSLDWKARNAEFIESCPGLIVDDVLAKIQAILED